MENAFPPFADIEAIVAELGDRPEGARLKGTLDQANRAHSCVSDLREAATCVEALGEMLDSIRRRGRLTRVATEAALLRAAVTLYERSTAAGAKHGERGSIQIRHKLGDQERRDHDLLVALRQRTYAHVYHQEDIEGTVWHDQVFFAIGLPDGQWRPATASHRVQFDRNAFEALKRQLPIAERLVTARFYRRLGELAEVLNSSSIDVSAFARHGFDPVVKFGSEDAVRSVLAGQTRGSASFGAP